MFKNSTKAAWVLSWVCMFADIASEIFYPIIKGLDTGATFRKSSEQIKEKQPGSFLLLVFGISV